MNVNTNNSAKLGVINCTVLSADVHCMSLSRAGQEPWEMMIPDSSTLYLKFQLLCQIDKKHG